MLAPTVEDLVALPPHILLVDADVDNREMYHEYLDACVHWPVSEASTVSEALAVMNDVGPEAVVFDLALPQIDGFDLCESLRGTPAGRDATLIALTGYRLKETERARLTTLGVAKVLAKPYPPSGLLADLQATITRARVMRARATDPRGEALQSTQSRALQARSRALLAYFAELCRDEAYRTLYQQIQQEYREWPALALTEAQICRLWNIPSARGAELVQALVRDGALRRTDAGAYRRVGI